MAAPAAGGPGAGGALRFTTCEFSHHVAHPASSITILVFPGADFRTVYNDIEAAVHGLPALVGQEDEANRRFKIVFWYERARDVAGALRGVPGAHTTSPFHDIKH